MPPEVVQLLAVPFFIFAGVIAKSIFDAVMAKMTSRVSHKQVAVSEKEANTHQFQAIVEGFTHALAAAGADAKRANERADTLEARMDKVERERDEVIHHLIKVEALVPNPPGPPPRPPWLSL